MRIRIIALAVAALALVASGAAAAAHHKHAARKGGALVKLGKTKLGKVIVASNGRTLYLYTPDAKNKSNCYGSCAGVWPPLLTKGKPRAGSGVKQKLLGVTMRKDGKHQVTYHGHPLYKFTGDSKAGQVNGQDYGGIWFVVNAAGKKVTSSTAGGGTTTSTNPYGY
jgi:predicted lipoprotein with Yx(FWY)xxD motif